MDSEVVNKYQDIVLNLGLKILAAIAFWVVGPVLAVRPHTHNDHYWQVYFDTNKSIRSALAGFPAPTPSQVVLVQQNQG